MWIATRHEGFDCPDGQVRTKELISEYGFFAKAGRQSCLRLSLLCKMIGLFIMFGSHYGFGGEGLYQYGLAGSSDDMRSNSKFRGYFVLACCFMFLSSGFLTSYQSLLSDDVAWARGYRAGSKILSYGCYFEIISMALQLAWASNFYINYDAKYSAFFAAGSIDWIFYAVARATSAMALLLTGFSFFLMEVYHDEGTSEWNGIISIITFTVAALAEILGLFENKFTWASSLTLIAVIIAFIWSVAFEEQVNATTPKYSESELFNELENDIQEIANNHPMKV